MALITELMALYEEKNAAFDRLLAILEKEGEILKTGNVAPLWSLAEEKKGAAEALAVLRDRIAQTLQREGRFSADTVAWDSPMLFSRLSHAERAALEPLLLRVSTMKERIRAAADANLQYLRLCLDVVGEMMAVFMRPPAQAGAYDRSRRTAGAGNAYVNRRV